MTGTRMDAACQDGARVRERRAGKATQSTTNALVLGTKATPSPVNAFVLGGRATCKKADAAILGDRAMQSMANVALVVFGPTRRTANALGMARDCSRGVCGSARGPRSTTGCAGAAGS
jgi:hypothetical protein